MNVERNDVAHARLHHESTGRAFKEAVPTIAFLRKLGMPLWVPQCGVAGQDERQVATTVILAVHPCTLAPDELL